MSIRQNHKIRPSLVDYQTCTGSLIPKNIEESSTIGPGNTEKLQISPWSCVCMYVCMYVCMNVHRERAVSVPQNHDPILSSLIFPINFLALASIARMGRVMLCTNAWIKLYIYVDDLWLPMLCSIKIMRDQSISVYKSIWGAPNCKEHLAICDSRFYNANVVAVGKCFE
jgi:hypothetical protein